MAGFCQRDTGICRNRRAMSFFAILIVIDKDKCASHHAVLVAGIYVLTEGLHQCFVTSSVNGWSVPQHI